MNDAIDPFSHHPELRGQIADPLQSFFRTFTTEALAARMRQMGLPPDWWHPDEKREAMRAATLAGRREADLWVFAYGSLMWDPGFRFAEVRRARVARGCASRRHDAVDVRVNPDAEAADAARVRSRNRRRRAERRSTRPLQAAFGPVLVAPIPLMPSMPAAMAFKLPIARYHGADARLELAGQRVFVVHCDDYGDAMACTGDWVPVCCGHSHRAEVRQVRSVKGGDTWLVNPGTVAGLAAPSTWVLGDLAAMRFELRSLGREVEQGTLPTGT